MKTTNEDDIRIMIYDIIAIGSTMNAYTVLLAEKMNTYASKNNIKIHVGSDTIGHIDESGSEVDVILLAPECYGMETDIKSRFPKKIVKVIDKVDYGALRIDKIIESIIHN